VNVIGIVCLALGSFSFGIAVGAAILALIHRSLVEGMK
jgi:hypothetical protein